MVNGVVPCPICDHPIPFEEDGCSRCRAERTRRRRPFYVFLLAAAALCVWQRDRIAGAWAGFLDEIEKVGRPRMRYAASDPPPASAATAPPAAPVPEPPPFAPAAVSIVYAPPPPPSPPPAVSESVAVDPPDKAPAKSPEIAPMPRPENGPPAPMSRMYGVVYDLSTLRPVPEAEVRFSVRDREIFWSVRTNDKGHYQVDVMTDPALLVSVQSPGYRTGALEDKDPPYRQRPAKSRRMTLEETTDWDLAPFPVRPHGDYDSIVQLDLVVFPERKP